MIRHTAKTARLRSTTRPEATQPHPVYSHSSFAAQQYVAAHLGSSSIVRIDPESVAPPRYRVHTEGIEKQPALKTSVAHDHIQCLRTEGKYVYFSHESFHLLFAHIMTPLPRHCQARSYPLTENRGSSLDEPTAHHVTRPMLGIRVYGTALLNELALMIGTLESIDG